MLKNGITNTPQPATAQHIQTTAPHKHSNCADYFYHIAYETHPNCNGTDLFHIYLIERIAPNTQIHFYIFYTSAKVIFTANFTFAEVIFVYLQTEQ